MDTSALIQKAIAFQQRKLPFPSSVIDKSNNKKSKKRIAAETLRKRFDEWKKESDEIFKPTYDGMLQRWELENLTQNVESHKDQLGREFPVTLLRDLRELSKAAWETAYPVVA